MKQQTFVIFKYTQVKYNSVAYPWSPVIWVKMVDRATNFRHRNVIVFSPMEGTNRQNENT